MHSRSVEQFIIHHDVNILILTTNISAWLVVVVHLLRNSLDTLAALRALPSLETLSLNLRLQATSIMRARRAESGSSFTLFLLSNSQWLLFLILLHSEVNLTHIKLLKLIVKVLRHILTLHILWRGTFKDYRVFAYNGRSLIILIVRVWRADLNLLVLSLSFQILVFSEIIISLSFLQLSFYDCLGLSIQAILIFTLRINARISTNRKFLFLIQRTQTLTA